MFNWKFWMELPSLVLAIIPIIVNIIPIVLSIHFVPLIPQTTDANCATFRMTIITKHIIIITKLSKWHIVFHLYITESERGEKNGLIFTANAWLSQLHGNVPLFGLVFTTGQDYPHGYYEWYPSTSVSMTMVMESLPCNPSFYTSYTMCSITTVQLGM